ncbi:MAG: putative photosynthetic complex assembly protein PuhE [Gammaproteobacteria bacterium]|nr:putative photosynthetic complex assembly protein PuhE [Gammaproteobacteria bacterium]
MSEYMTAFAFALFLWWFGTGLVLLLNHLPRRTHRWSVLIVGVTAVACLVGIGAGSSETTTVGALVAFSQALVVWAWLEISYFTGMLTGPRKSPCPASAQGWTRFRLALQTSLYHELAVVLLGLLIVYLTWDAANRVATGTFLTLWLMRWSAKLNLFFGVANVNADWLPERLRFLTTYMGRGPINLFFPLAVTLATALAVLLFAAAIVADAAFLRSAYTLVGSLLLFAVLEHWFMVLPLRDSTLWAWALKLAGTTVTRRRSCAT